MLPTNRMVANKKLGAIHGTFFFLAAGSFLVFGCRPPGPTALLQGERAIHEGNLEVAVEQLQKATRLLPKNAQAWNHLGLAYHGSRQPAQALRAYRQALACDYKLAAAHYNLGCLHLEQNDPAAAVDELTSYTLLQPKWADGWLKLGEAQLALRRLDLAEKSFKIALELRPRHPEALNGLGMIALQRRRPQDAFNHFNLALAQSPNYGPALLNLAVVAQQNLYNRSLALQRYRQYLAIQPHPANWEAVAALANQLEVELNPPATRPAHTNLVAAPVAKTNLAPIPANLAARNSTTAGAAVGGVPRASHSALATGSRSAPSSSAPTTNPISVASKASAPESTRTTTPTSDRIKEIQVTRLADEPVDRPAQEVSLAPLTQTGALDNRGETAPSPLASTKPEAKTDKRGLFSRMIPFGGKPKPGTENTTAAPSSEVAFNGRSPDDAVDTNPVRPTPPPVARYAYRSPVRPGAGNRRNAEPFFAEGVKAQKAGQLAQAVAAYATATRTDPGYFEAYYNQGLAAYEMADWKQCLAPYEFALALQPDSRDARYNFALALKQASYFLDAAEELLKLLKDNPNEARAHLSLANLYAQQLHDSKLAREHYLKLLELEPRHPQAGEIRYWLATNP